MPNTRFRDYYVYLVKWQSIKYATASYIYMYVIYVTNITTQYKLIQNA